MSKTAYLTVSLAVAVLLITSSAAALHPVTPNQSVVSTPPDERSPDEIRAPRASAQNPVDLDRSLGDAASEWRAAVASIGSPAPVAASDSVGGFVLGVATSVSAAVGWKRLERHLAVSRIAEQRIRGPAAAAWSRLTGSEQTSSEQTSSGPREEADGGIAEEFVPDDVRVRRLLERENGRMMQSDIVERTDWSKSKVSRLLSTMEAEGTIVKISLGRENLVCLDGNVPDVPEVSER